MSNSNGPKYRVFISKEGKEGKNFYTEVGVAWAFKEKDGLSIELDALPVDGKLVLFPPKAKEDS